jgi:predicted acetyltransferase
MTIEFRRFREDELEQAWEMDREAFNSADSGRERFMDYSDPSRMHGAFVSGRAVAMTNVLPCVHYFGGRRVEAGGVSSVTVTPDYRGQGLASRILADAITGMRNHGEVVSSLYPANSRLYREMGWEFAGSCFYREIPARALLDLERPEKGRVRKAEPSDLPGIKESYRRFAAEHNGLLDGPLRWWSLDRQFASESTFVAVDDGGQVRGMVRYERLPIGRPGAPWSIRVHQLFAETAEALHGLGWLVGSSSSQADKVYYPSAPVDPLALLLPSRLQRVTMEAPWMLRVLDIPVAISQRGFPVGLEAEVSLAVEDDLSPDSGMPFRLSVGAGEGRVEAAASADLRLGIGAFSALYSGAINTATLIASGMLTGGSVEDRARLDACFSGPLPFMLEEF